MKWKNGEPTNLDAAYAVEDTQTGDSAIAVYSYMSKHWVFAGHSDGSPSTSWMAGQWPGWKWVLLHEALRDEIAPPPTTATLADIARAIREAIAAKTSPDMGTLQCEQVLLLTKAFAVLSS